MPQKPPLFPPLPLWRHRRKQRRKPNSRRISARWPSSVSRTPAARPKDFSKAVEAAVASAVRSEPQPKPAEPEQVVQAAVKAAPEADQEPETQSAAPRIPTRASVAKQATFVNAINLSKTNLIGVYGSASNRYAMVRQANGRYKKVKVGDKVDGATVAAITGNELRLKKGNRMIALTMPKG